MSYFKVVEDSLNTLVVLEANRFCKIIQEKVPFDSPRIKEALTEVIAIRSATSQLLEILKHHDVLFKDYELTYSDLMIEKNNKSKNK